MGTVDQEGRLEQIKGVSYILHQFLGQQAESYNNNEGTADAGGQCEVVDRKERGGGGGGRELHYMTIYLSPGDYHGFHSPANWRAHTRRHFPGIIIRCSIIFCHGRECRTWLVYRLPLSVVGTWLSVGVGSLVNGLKMIGPIELVYSNTLIVQDMLLAALELL